jgi:predicted DNA-binding protein
MKNGGTNNHKGEANALSPLSSSYPNTMKKDAMLIIRTATTSKDGLQTLADREGRSVSNYLNRLIEAHIASNLAPAPAQEVVFTTKAKAKKTTTKKVTTIKQLPIKTIPKATAGPGTYSWNRKIGKNTAAKGTWKWILTAKSARGTVTKTASVKLG